MRTLTTMTRRRTGLITSIAIAAAALAAPATALDRAACQSDGAFVWVEGGPYIAGSDTPERDFAYHLSATTTASTPEGIAADEADLRSNKWFDNEPARETRTLPSFCIARTQVTNAGYLAFTQQTHHRPPGISAPGYQKQGFLYHPYSKVEQFLWRNHSYPPGDGDHPVVLVSYDDALHFAIWKSAQDGRSYRLPTADEWEKAARGPDGRRFPWGNDWRNDASNWAGSGLDHTAPVSAFPAALSLYGVEGLAGQVFEFTSTLVNDPSGLRAVMKNCGWDDSPGFCRPAYRHTRPTTSRHILIGFRLVRE